MLGRSSRVLPRICACSMTHFGSQTKKHWDLAKSEHNMAAFLSYNASRRWKELPSLVPQQEQKWQLIDLVPSILCYLLFMVLVWKMWLAKWLENLESDTFLTFELFSSMPLSTLYSFLMGLNSILDKFWVLCDFLTKGIIWEKSAPTCSLRWTLVLVTEAFLFPLETSSFVFPSVSLPFDLLSWNNTPLGKTKLFLEGSEIMCVLYHYIKVSLAWESEVCWLRNKKKSSNFTKTSYTKLKSLLTWSYQSSLHNYRRLKYL